MKKSRDDLVSLTDRYRAILKEEASRKALYDVLALFQEIAGVNLEMPDDVNGQDEESSRRLLGEALELAEPSLGTIRRERRSRRFTEDDKRTIYQAIAALTLPRIYQTLDLPLSRQRASLLLDAAQVVFHQAYFVWAADSAELPKHFRDALLGSFLRFAHQLSSSADSFRTVALVIEAYGNPELADYFSRRALSATSADAHEYLTVLQSAWGRYIDTGRFGLAMLLLCDELPRVLPANFAEFRELAEQTLEMWHNETLTIGSHA